MNENEMFTYEEYWEAVARRRREYTAENRRIVDSMNQRLDAVLKAKKPDINFMVHFWDIDKTQLGTNLEQVSGSGGVTYFLQRTPLRCTCQGFLRSNAFNPENLVTKRCKHMNNFSGSRESN